MISTDLPLSDRYYSAADALRTTIVDLFGGVSAEQVILSPGILVAIEVLSGGTASKVVLTTAEYYSSEHFPGRSVTTCPASELLHVVVTERPDIVIVSV